MPLWVTVSGLAPNNAQTVTLTTFPDAIPTPAPNSVNISNGLTLDTIPASYPADLAFQLELAKNNA